MIEITYADLAINHMEDPDGVAHMIPNTAGPKVYYRTRIL